MSASASRTAPPFCPNERCPFHSGPTRSWRWVRAGSFRTLATPGRIQRYQCRHCRRHFSEQTFRASYWLKCPELLLTVAQRLVSCSGFRQISRELDVSPQTVLGLSARIGRHCLLFHERHRPKGELTEPLALDGFVSFEWSQYHPTQFHIVVGQRSHYIHGFTDSEVRRSGTMRAGQRRKRARLEALHGRPDPRSVEHEVAALLRIVTAGATHLELHTDEHQAYPRALARLGHLASVEHRTVSSRALRDTRNPLFAINLLDLLIRHSGANHKRETIAFSKRHQAVIWRAAWLLAWQNFAKPFSERHGGGTPAMRAGLCERPLAVEELLRRRRFPGRIRLAEEWRGYYHGQVPTRRIRNEARPTLKLAQ